MVSSILLISTIEIVLLSHVNSTMTKIDTITKIQFLAVIGKVEVYLLFFSHEFPFHFSE
ncbi:Uncharacterised protein [Chlamydia trachomatis]|nr:Uncharacterised protein [Chlamydia trachomatis]